MTIMTMNCMHGHYAGRCSSRLCECRCHLPLIGRFDRATREWEVWDHGNRVGKSPRWHIWHPLLTAQEVSHLSDLHLATLQDALDEIAVIEWLHTDRFDQWRNSA